MHCFRPDLVYTAQTEPFLPAAQLLPCRAAPSQVAPDCSRAAMTLAQEPDMHFSCPAFQGPCWPLSTANKAPQASNSHSSVPTLPLDHGHHGLIGQGCMSPHHSWCGWRCWTVQALCWLLKVVPRNWLPIKPQSTDHYLSSLTGF